MRGLKPAWVVLGGMLFGAAACGGGDNGGSDDDEPGGKGGGAGSSTGGSSGGSGGSSASGGSGGSSASGGTGGSGGSSASGGTGGAAAGTSGASGKGGTGGGAGSGPMPCDTSGFEWEDPGCPAGYLRTFGDPVCSNVFKCIIGSACAGLSCDTCIETAAFGYAMNDVCISGITEAELREVCLGYALDYSVTYPECAPEP